MDLILHVNDVWITSEWARKNIERMLGRYAQSQVKRNPSPRAWLIGDLSDHDAVMSLLEMSGVGHRRSS